MAVIRFVGPAVEGRELLRYGLICLFWAAMFALAIFVH